MARGSRREPMAAVVQHASDLAGAGLSPSGVVVSREQIDLIFRTVAKECQNHDEQTLHDQPTDSRRRSRRIGVLRLFLLFGQNIPPLFVLADQTEARDVPSGLEIAQYACRNRRRKELAGLFGRAGAPGRGRSTYRGRQQTGHAPTD